MNKRKGITPIIAIVLLLMMTVATVRLAWTFIQSTMVSQQTKTEAELEEMGMTKLLEVIQIENDGVADVANEWIVTVRNPGEPVTIDVTNLLVKVDGRLVALSAKSVDTAALTTGENTVIRITWPTGKADWPAVTDVPLIVELELNTDYRFSYSCKANQNYPLFC